MINNLGGPETISERQLEFYARRAEGGIGMLITEAMVTHPSGVPSRFYAGLYNQGVADQWTPLADKCRDNDTLLIGQLFHAGGRGYVSNVSAVPWAVAQHRDFVSGTVPHPMNTQEIEEVIGAFCESAARLVDAGFAGVELHAAHDFLLAQFLSPRLNQRDDEWGGDPGRRVRIVERTILALRERLGPEAIVGMKLTGDDYADGGTTNELAAEYVSLLMEAAPPDYIAVSMGSFGWGFDRHLPDMRFPSAPYVSNAEAIRAATHGRAAVMALGRVDSLEAADSVIGSGIADMVGLGRPLLADPATVGKWLGGDKARPCIYCNRCWHELQQGRPAYCTFATEERVPAPPTRRGETRQRPRIHVVGAGPAGLEFTRVAAADGAEVIVHEAESRAGGHLRLESTLAARGETFAMVDWWVAESEAQGVKFLFGERVEGVPDGYREGDVVVEAVGRHSAPPTWAVAMGAVAFENAIADPSRFTGNVLIIDSYDDEPVYALAEVLATRGCDVSLVSAQEYVGRHLAIPSRMGVLRRLSDSGVIVSTTAEVVAHPHNRGRLTVRHLYSRREVESRRFDHVVCAGPLVSRPSVSAASVRARQVGDMVCPRPLEGTLEEARRVAFEVTRQLEGAVR